MNELSKEIWQNNYKAENEKTIEDTWKRIAKAVASIEPSEKEIWEKAFYTLLEDFKFIPGGRILANLGVEGRKHTTLMNCYVHHPKDIGLKDPDSIKGIYTLLLAQAETLKSEGGYGTNFSWLRPAGTYIKGIGGRTPGVLKFMELWDKSSEIITSGCDKRVDELRKEEKVKIRKGAQMAVLNIWHPDIEDFITAKQNTGCLTKFNMSIGITDAFMDAVVNDENWDLVFPDVSDEAYKETWNGDLDDWLKDGNSTVVYKTIKAKELWDTIMFSTYTRNEPGVIFLDTMNKLNPIQYAEKILQSNPCGEIGMSTGVCNLGSLNLVKFTSRNCDGEYFFDFKKLREATTVAIRFLDNINDLSDAPLPEYKQSMIEKRRVGLGTLGFGSLCFLLEYKYGSTQSKDLLTAILCNKAEAEILASAQLGKEKGSFKLFNWSLFFNTEWWKNLKINDLVKLKVEQIGEMRNSCRSAHAPTGNTSVLAGSVSSGIEPVFMKEYIRWVIVSEEERRRLKRKGFKFPNNVKGEWFSTIHLKFVKNDNEEQELAGNFNSEQYKFEKNRGLIKAVNVTDYGWNLMKDSETAKFSPETFATTEDLEVSDHLDILEICAHRTDMGVSKTVNIPKEYPYEDFKNIYIDGWKRNIKGITTYRSGTMAAVLEKRENIKKHQSALEKALEEAGEGVLADNVSLPNEYYSKGFKIRSNGAKKWYVNIAFVDETYTKPFAIFISTNNRETQEVADVVIDGMTEICLNAGIEKALVEEQIDKCNGQSNVVKIARMLGMALRHNIQILTIVTLFEQYDIEFSSLLYHLTKLLSKYIEDGTQVKNEACPECKETLVFQTGCKMCPSCFWGKC